MRRDSVRSEWISYLRVSTHEQAERDLSLPAQRHAVEEYAARHGAKIAREYVEAGCSGTSANRKAFRKMLEDVLRPNSTVGTVIVHHTSRFTRDSTEARLVKQRLRKEGVRVLSVCQETTEDPIGNLIEGIFECIDQYESEVNGMRTSLAMMESIRQGYFPSSWTPYGFRRVKVEIRPSVVRWTLEHEEEEAKTVLVLFQLYIAGSGAKSVAMQLNERGLLYRRDRPWSTKLVLHVLDEPAVAGTYYWGRWSTKRKTRSNEAEWVPLPVTPIVTPAVHELVMKLRKQREPSRRPGRPISPANLLAGVVRCGKCGASYQLETSGKRVRGDLYEYRYYNCSKFCRIGSAVCSGYRIRTHVLDEAVLVHLYQVRRPLTRDGLVNKRSCMKLKECRMLPCRDVAASRFWILERCRSRNRLTHKTRFAKRLRYASTALNPGFGSPAPKLVWTAAYPMANSRVIRADRRTVR